MFTSAALVVSEAPQGGRLAPRRTCAPAPAEGEEHRSGKAPQATCGDVRETLGAGELEAGDLGSDYGGGGGGGGGDRAVGDDV